MQTMDHAIVMARPKGMTPQRATGLAFAGLLQVALIFALVEGLNIKVWPTPTPSTSVEIIKETTKPEPGPPPTPTMHNPVAVSLVMPTYHFDDGSQTNQGITTVVGPATPSYDEIVTGIAGTHTTPPYPALAVRLGEEGSVRLHLTISPQGIVTEALVVRSSGFGDLDQAARNWIMAHRRYRPAMRGGAAVASVSDVLVRFDLRNAR
jgi:periplasmic protein TonB